MAIERNNTAMDFEAMLRSHVQGSSAPVECDGFDADAASAYLENGLARQAHAAYESHLALCHPCRQQLIQLVQLFDLETTVATPLPVIEWHERAWQSVNAKVGQWMGGFDFGWNVQTAAWAGGALATMLFATFAFQALRPSPQIISSPINVATVASAPRSEGFSAGTPAATPADVSSVLNEHATVRPLITPATSGSVVPRPEVTPNIIASGAFASERLQPTADAPTFTPTQPVAAPTVVAQLPSGFGSSGVQPMVVSQMRGPDLAKLGGSQPLQTVEEEIARNEVGSRMSLSPSDNPMRTASLRTMERRTTAPQSPPPAWGDRVMGFMPYKKDEKERTAEKLPVEDESLKAMKIRIRDRVFYFSSGAWIDNDYRPEMAWRVTRLVRESEEYNRVLAESPGLKAYFAKGAITVVWGDKIYKVVGK